MQAHYYYVHIDDNPKDQLTFNDIESMQVFLINNPQNDPAKNGILFHSQLTGIKIEYNMYTGYVAVHNIESKKEITFIFSFEAFEAKLTPVKEAICWRAKHDLLSKLHSFNNPHINNFIDKHKLRFDNNIQASMNSHTLLDKALRQILNYIQSRKNLFYLLFLNKAEFSQGHEGLYLALKNCKIDDIKSTKDVDRIMQEIEMNMKEKSLYQSQISKQK